MHNGKQRSCKKGFKFGANIVGGTVGLAASLVAASLVIVKGPLHLLGMLGARLQEVGGLSPEEKEKQKQRGLILYASLWQAIGDSYSLWTLGGESPFHEMRQREKAPKDLQTLLDIGANIYGENIFNDTSNNFEFIMELNYDPEVRKQFNRKEPEKIYTEMLGKSREEFLKI
ncbi:MAG: hypothetical protein HWD61_03000 [Parachlamydiaceae bacterium]|nr:MAG: hypothetical protein HWD61_03000 [Parachlamydiaceae bacterium]